MVRLDKLFNRFFNTNTKSNADKRNARKKALENQHTNYLNACFITFVKMIVWAYIGVMISTLATTTEGIDFARSYFPSDVKNAPYTSTDNGKSYWEMSGEEGLSRIPYNLLGKNDNALLDSYTRNNNMLLLQSILHFPLWIAIKKWVSDTTTQSFSITRDITKTMFGAGGDRSNGTDASDASDASDGSGWVQALGILFGPAYFGALILFIVPALMSIGGIVGSQFIINRGWFAFMLFPLFIALGGLSISVFIAQLIGLVVVPLTNKPFREKMTKMLKDSHLYFLILFLGISGFSNGTSYLVDTQSKNINYGLTSCAILYFLNKIRTSGFVKDQPTQ